MSQVALERQRISPVPVFPFRWYQGPRLGPTFDAPEAYFIVGNPDTGKSNQSMAIVTNFLANGHKNIDAWGVEAGAEELVWFYSPYRDRTIMLHGDEVEVDTKFAKLPISKFTLDTLNDYDIAVTTHDLYGTKYSHYDALYKIFQLCQARRGWKKSGKVITLTVREAWEIVYSLISAGISRDEQVVQMEIKKMNKERFHTGIAPILDSQRYMEIETSVRQLTNFRIIKGFGGQVIPDEFKFLFKPHLFLYTDWRLRNLPPDEFIMVTSKNGVCDGMVDKVPWNTHKGEYLIDELKIIVHKLQAQEEERKEVPKPEIIQVSNPYRKIEVHNKIVELYNARKTFLEIADIMTKAGEPMTWFKARYHALAQCNCE